MEQLTLLKLEKPRILQEQQAPFKCYKPNSAHLMETLMANSSKLKEKLTLLKLKSARIPKDYQTTVKRLKL